MKNILIVSQYFYPERFRVNDLASQLVKKGFKVTVLTGLPNYPEGKFFKGFNLFKRNKNNRYEGVEIIRLPVFSRGRNKLSLAINYISFLFSGFLFATFTKRKFDTVFTYGISPILQAIPAIVYSKKNKVKSYLYLMDFWPYSIEAVDGIKSKTILKVISKISIWIYKKTDRILISSEGYKEGLLNLGVQESNITYWPQYHEDFYTPRENNYLLTPELDPSKFNFIFTGNLGNGQGIDLFLENIKEHIENFKSLNINFVFIGDGIEKNRLIKFTHDYQLTSIVKFIGSKKPDEIPQYLSNSQGALLLVNKHPHLSYVLPAKVSSYVGCKIPILCISYDPLGSFIENFQYGISTNSYDSKVISSKIQYFVETHTIIKAKVNQSVDNFQSSTLINQFIELIS
jgi:glycosyltransferase involved in cell wall biosynthesis